MSLLLLLESMNYWMNVKSLPKNLAECIWKVELDKVLLWPANVIYSLRCLMKISGQANLRILVGDGMLKGTSYGWTLFTPTSNPSRWVTLLLMYKGVAYWFCAFIRLWQFAFCNSSAWVSTCLSMFRRAFAGKQHKQRGSGTLRCCCFLAK